MRRPSSLSWHLFSVRVEYEGANLLADDLARCSLKLDELLQVGQREEALRRQLGHTLHICRLVDRVLEVVRQLVQVYAVVVAVELLEDR